MLSHGFFLLFFFSFLMNPFVSFLVMVMMTGNRIASAVAEKWAASGTKNRTAPSTSARRTHLTTLSTSPGGSPPTGRSRFPISSAARRPSLCSWTSDRRSHPRTSNVRSRRRQGPAPGHYLLTDAGGGGRTGATFSWAARRSNRVGMSMNMVASINADMMPKKLTFGTNGVKNGVCPSPRRGLLCNAM